MNGILQTLITSILGSAVIVNGLAVNVPDILTSAHHVMGQENKHQLAIALELYYLDHDQYPEVADGQHLLSLLKEKDYIQNLPLRENRYHYTPKDNGQNYSLSVDQVTLSDD